MAIEEEDVKAGLAGAEEDPEFSGGFDGDDADGADVGDGGGDDSGGSGGGDGDGGADGGGDGGGDGAGTGDEDAGDEAGKKAAADAAKAKAAAAKAKKKPGDGDADGGEDGEEGEAGEDDGEKDLQSEIAKAVLESEGKKLTDEEKAAADAAKAQADANKAKEEAAKAKKAGGDGAGGDLPSEIQGIIDSVGDIEIHTVDADGKKKTATVKDIAKEYPEMVQLAAVIANQRVSKETADAKSAVRQLHAEIQDLRFWNELTDPASGIPDARQIAVSKEFTEWVKKQSPEIQKLYGSPNPGHAKLVIKAFKNDVAKTAANKTDKKAERAKGLRRAAIKDSAGGGGAGGGSGGGGGEDEFDKGFDED